MKLTQEQEALMRRLCMEQLLNAEQNECPLPKAPEDQGEVVTDIEMPLLLMIEKCGGKLDNFCRYFCEAFDNTSVCNYCEDEDKEKCGEVAACASALAKYIRAEVSSCEQK